MTPAQAKQRKAALDVKIEGHRAGIKVLQAKVKTLLAEKASIKTPPKPKKKAAKK